MKFNTYSFLILSLLFFTSCEKSEDTPISPTIQFNEGASYASIDTALYLGEKVSISIHATQGNSPITLFQYSINKDGEITTIDSGMHTDQFSFEKTITKSIAEIETWTFMVRDNNLQSAEIQISFTKKGTPSYGGINQKLALILGAQNNTSSGSFYSFESDSVFFLDAAAANQESINLLYYFDELSDEDNVISSPGASIDESVFPGEEIGLLNWDTKLTTRFIKMTGIISIEEFDACENDSLILENTFEFSAGKRKCKNLVPNDIYSFATEDKLEGLIKIIQVEGEKDGWIEFDIKWRQF